MFLRLPLQSFKARCKDLEAMVPVFERLQELVLTMRAELDVKDKVSGPQVVTETSAQHQYVFTAQRSQQK